MNASLVHAGMNRTHNMSLKPPYGNHFYPNSLSGFTTFYSSNCILAVPL